MRDEDFQELLQSVRDLGAWLRGEHVEGIRVRFMGEPDPREVRAKRGMTREAFAAALCITLDDLRRWEQGHRNPKLRSREPALDRGTLPRRVRGVRLANECRLEVYTLSRAVCGRGCEPGRAGEGPPQGARRIRSVRA